MVRRAGFQYALLTAVVVLAAIAGYRAFALYPRFGLPAVDAIGLLVLSAAAGVASFFSPCSFPLLVTLLAREVRAEEVEEATARLRRAAAYAGTLSLGAAAFLLLAGAAIAAGGQALFAAVTFTSAAGRALRIVVGLVLILLGLMQLAVLPFPKAAIERLARPLLRSQAELRRTAPRLGFALFGFAYLVAGFG